jgi:pimeloyl-ACP methyl ester carboxylesterase
MENKIKMARPKRKAIFISVICTVVGIPLILIPIITIIVYESIFGARYETAPYLEFKVGDFEGLRVERSDFYEENGTQIAGYKYSREGEAKGVVIVAHGLGGGGHNAYMPFIDYFTKNGYLVFTYEAHGNDNSEGDSVEGLPQGVIDLDLAIEHAQKEYDSLPIMLFGHSWGAYSCGAVLNLHKDIKGAVIVAGFNKSDNLLLHQAESRVGIFAKVGIPSVSFYENVKFGGEYANLTSIDGFEGSSARVLIVHSKDDSSVPTKYGYDLFYSKLANNDRFEFLLYDNKGHTDILYSDNALSYMDSLENGYERYLEQNDKQDSQNERNFYMNKNANKKACFEPNPDIASGALRVFEGK